MRLLSAVASVALTFAAEAQEPRTDYADLEKLTNVAVFAFLASEAAVRVVKSNPTAYTLEDMPEVTVTAMNILMDEWQRRSCGKGGDNCDLDVVIRVVAAATAATLAEGD